MFPEGTHQADASADFISSTSSSISQYHKQSKPDSGQPDSSREAFWRGIIQQRLQAGLNIREFCRREQLSESAYHYWKREIAKRDGQPFNGKSKKKTTSKQDRNSQPTFIPVSLDSVAMHQPQIEQPQVEQPQIEQPQIEQPQIEILYASGTTVRIASGCDATTISVILQAMGNRTC